MSLRKESKWSLLLILALAILAILAFTAIPLTKHIEKAVTGYQSFTELSELSELQQRLTQSYFDGDIDKAIPDLVLLISVMCEQLENEKGDPEILKIDIALAYARLALAYQRQQDQEKFELNLQQAQAYASESPYIKEDTDLLEAVQKMDRKIRETDQGAAPVERDSQELPTP